MLRMNLSQALTIIPINRRNFSLANKRNDPNIKSNPCKLLMVKKLTLLMKKEKLKQDG